MVTSPLQPSSNKNSSSSSSGVEVHLAVYDLARGMARALSEQFLGGPQYSIDVIPHTALLVYGQEYFFGGGGGIQFEDPVQFRRNMGLQPIQINLLGRTQVPRSEFEAWCRQKMRFGQPYHPNSYNLLTHNCNHFSHDAALHALKLPQGVPQWILDVPQRVMASPMGQLLLPMLQNMQVTHVQGAIPVSAVRHDHNNSQSPALSVPNTANASSNGNVTSKGTHISSVNPWADFPSQSNLKNPPPTSSDSSKTQQAENIIRTPLLDSFTKPLLSNDTQTVNLCVSKIRANQLDEEALKTLDKTAQALMGPSSSLSSSESTPLDEETCIKTCGILLHCLQTNTSVTFVLLLLRILTLQPCFGTSVVRSTKNSNLSTSNTCLDCLFWIQQTLTSNTTAVGEKKSPSLRSAAVCSAAWLTISNAMACTISFPKPLSTSDFITAALADSSVDNQPRPEVRQAACAFLFNTTLNFLQKNTLENNDTDELPDVLVSLLCASLEGLDKENNATVKLRLLMILGRIIKCPCFSAAARRLVSDLGFVEALQLQLATHNENGNTLEGNASDIETCRTLGNEILQTLMSST